MGAKINGTGQKECEKDNGERIGMDSQTGVHRRGKTPGLEKRRGSHCVMFVCVRLFSSLCVGDGLPPGSRAPGFPRGPTKSTWGSVVYRAKNRPKTWFSCGHYLVLILVPWAADDVLRNKILLTKDGPI